MTISELRKAIKELKSGARIYVMVTATKDDEVALEISKSAALRMYQGMAAGIMTTASISFIGDIFIG